MASSRFCKHNPDCFCYVCGVFLGSKAVKHRIKDANNFCLAYSSYFGMPVGDQDKKWAPHVVCGCCRSTLEAWYRGENRKMKFGVPRIWREPTDHLSNCYFCVTDLSHHKRCKKTNVFAYPDLPSSLRPIPHGEELPIPPSPVLNECEDTTESNTEIDHEEDFSEDEDATPHYPTQNELNDLIRDLGLTKSKAEILSSRLKQWNLLSKSCKISSQRKRHEPFSQYFTLTDKLCYCHNVLGLFKEIGFNYDPKDWRLFIDSSCKSLKAVLLHNGNKYPSIPIAHSTHLKEQYSSVQHLLQVLKYAENQWDVIGDFKMIAFLMGLQGGNTKNPCFLCLWDSRDTGRHFQTVEWPLRSEFVVGQKNVKWEPLVEQEKILLPPLHIKLGLIKQFVKALDPTSDAMKYLQNVFPKLSEAKIKGGIFVGPQVKKLLRDDTFISKLLPVQRKAWKSFGDVVNGFLGNHRMDNYRDVVEDLLKNYKSMGCRMSLKLHVLHSHLNVFKSHMGAYSEEQGERFHQDLQLFERRYQGQYNERMLGDYIWGLIRDSDVTYKRKCRNTTHF